MRRPIKVVVGGKVVWGFLYDKVSKYIKQTRYKNKVYKYEAKTIVFRVPRDLEDCKFIIIPLDKNAKVKKVKLEIMG